MAQVSAKAMVVSSSKGKVTMQSKEAIPSVNFD